MIPHFISGLIKPKKANHGLNLELEPMHEQICECKKGLGYIWNDKPVEARKFSICTNSLCLYPVLYHNNASAMHYNRQ